MLTPGQRHDMVAAPELLDHARGDHFIADTGYDSDDLRRAIRAKGMKPVVHSHPRRTKKRPVRRYFYRKRYLVEVFFHKVKRFRAIGTRYEKTARNYLALLHLVCTYISL